MPSRINLANVILTPREWCVQKVTFKVSSRKYIFLLLNGSVVLLYEFSCIMDFLQYFTLSQNFIR